MIDRETAQKIKDTANIVEVVGEYVHLIRRGANFMGLCPFHNERTPSFSVNPKKNFCHCFSCHKGGSPVNFLMEKEGISYHEALLRLAKKYNIHVEERELTEEERQRMSEREAMMVASEWAMNHFHDNLFNTEEGRDIGLSYLYSRGISDEAIKRFKLGYSIEQGNALLKRAQAEGFDVEVLKNIGLIGTSQSGRDYDKFRGRIIFPIRNTSGKPIAFGGRTLKGDMAKYINSPETQIYKKSNELYGIYEAKDAIGKDDRVFLMEGYLDVIGTWQTGIKNVVASSGTALTEGQISLIHRFTDNVTLIYDGDSAGIKASLRGIDMLLTNKLHVKVLLLPEGEDPDSFARKVTVSEFKDYLEQKASDFIDFKLKVLLDTAGEDPIKKANAIQSVVNSIACIPNELERIVYIQKCSSLTGVDEQIIAQQVKKALYYKAAAQKAPTVPPVTPTAVSPPTLKPEKPEKETDILLSKQEEEIIKYCVRYAYLPVVEETEDGEETEEMLVIEYINEELQADSIMFSNKSFEKIFNLLLGQSLSYQEEFLKFEQYLLEDAVSKKDQFYNEISIKGGSMEQVKKAEEEFTVNLEKQQIEKRKKFAMKYSVDFLLNHEDAEVRTVSIPLVEDRHQLSVIFKNEVNKEELTDEVLLQLINRALTELRCKILDSRILKVTSDLVKAESDKDDDNVALLMKDLKNLLHLRSRFAESLGERIISPR